MNSNAKTYIDQLTSKGEISFTAKKMQVDLKCTSKAAERAIYRLKKSKEIVGIVKGYYLILTPKFRKMGCLPADYFIIDLMNHWKQKYYVGLLSAALYFGAAHQQAQIFQVVVDRHRRSIHCGRVRIEFITKKIIVDSEVTQLKARSGMMNISTPAATMMDLCLYLRQSGAWGHVATILHELGEAVKPADLKKLLLKNKELTWVQRLGYILEKLGHSMLSQILYNYLKNKKLNIVGLAPYYPITGAPRDAKWKIAINAKWESDLNDFS